MSGLTLRFQVDVLGVLLLRQLLHSEGFPVRVNMVEHVGVLISSEPLVLPVETQGFVRLEKHTQVLFGHVDSIDPATLTRSIKLIG